jgi:hypothetical protein
MEKGFKVNKLLEGELLDKNPDPLDSSGLSNTPH